MSRTTVIAATILCAASVAAMPGPAARAQGVDRLNHDVQRLWDDTFHPDREADRRAWERQREIERHDWCRAHADYERCGPYR